jgi:hypothetical protein
MVVSAAVAHRIPAGWYRDRDDRTLRRWWDGVAWTDYYSPYTLPITVAAEAILTPAESESTGEVAPDLPASVEPVTARMPRSAKSTLRRALPLSIAVSLAIANLVLAIILANGG